MLDEEQIAEIQKAKQAEREKVKARLAQKVEKFEVIHAELGGDQFKAGKGKSKSKKAKAKAKT